MSTLQERVYNSAPIATIDEDPVFTSNEASVVVRLLDYGQYAERISVQQREGEEIISTYEFDTAANYYRVTTHNGDADVEIPVSILHCVADFGYYVRYPPWTHRVPWGQFEHLTDVVGRFERRKRQTSNPIREFFFNHLTFRFQLITRYTAAHTESNLTGGVEQIQELVEVNPEMTTETAKMSVGDIELQRLPFADETLIPDTFEQCEITPGVTAFDFPSESVDTVNISTQYKEDQNTVAVIVSLPASVRYFKLNGKPGKKCSLEFTEREEFPGPFVEQYLKETMGIKIGNTPSLTQSDTDVELLEKSRSLLANIEQTDGLQLPSEIIPAREQTLDFISRHLRVEEIIGEDRILEVADQLFKERLDGVGVEAISNTSFKQFTEIGLMLSLAIQRLTPQEKEQLEGMMTEEIREEIDDGTDIDEYLSSIGEELIQIDSEFGPY